MPFTGDTRAAPRRRSVWKDTMDDIAPDQKVPAAPREPDRRLSYTPARARQEEQFLYGQRKKYGWGIIILAILVIAGAGLGLGVVALRRRQNLSSTTTKLWRPKSGTTFQIELAYPLNDTTPEADVYTIDLYTNTPATVAYLHTLGRKVICHFSAGTYEDYLPDHLLFHSNDIGGHLEEKPGEFWLDTRSPNVRSLMTARLDLAAGKGCDGIDPDYTDSYVHNTGFPLSKNTAVDFVKFLAVEAHNRNLSIGLKNSPELVDQTLDLVQWQMNENCEQFNSCAQFQPFISKGMPVFHIVYPVDTPTALKSRYCSTADTQGFSTTLKSLVLDNWLDIC